MSLWSEITRVPSSELHSILRQHGGVRLSCSSITGLQQVWGACLLPPDLDAGLLHAVVQASNDYNKRGG